MVICRRPVVAVTRLYKGHPQRHCLKLFECIQLSGNTVFSLYTSIASDMMATYMSKVANFPTQRVFGALLVFREDILRQKLNLETVGYVHLSRDDMFPPLQ